MDEQLQRRVDDLVDRFHQPHVALFPFIGTWVRTPLGEGKLLAVFATSCEVHPTGTKANGKPLDTFRVPPEDVEPVGEK
jgi:hypothetical protein